MKLGAVYQIVNKINGRRYIGSSIEFEKRWATHRRELVAGGHVNSHLQRAWNKYGPDAFEFRTVWICDVDRMLEAEQFYITSSPAPYNMTPVVGRPDFSGRRHSEAARQKMRLAIRSRRPISEETRLKMSAAHKREWVAGRHAGKWTHTAAAKAKIAAASKARCDAGFLPPTGRRFTRDVSVV